MHTKFFSAENLDQKW